MRRILLFCLLAGGWLHGQTLINGDRVILGSINAARSNVGTDSYALTLASCTGFAYSARQPFVLEADVANTGVASVNVCGAGAKTIKKCGGADLVTGDIKAGDFLVLQYSTTTGTMQAHGLCGVSVTSGALTFQGLWNANTNTPTLADGTGTQGQYYVVSVAGSVDLGSGSKTYTVGDWVLHNGATWDKLDAINDVSSVFGRTGVIVATAGDYTASQVTNVPAGGVGAVTVQAAIDELDTEKAAASHSHAAADITSGTMATARLGSGTANSTTCLRGDQSWATCATGGGGSGSGSAGSLYLSTTATTSVTANTYAKLNGTTTSVNLSDFTMPANNRLTYTGSTTTRFNVVAVVSLQASGSNQTVSVRMAKNGTTDVATQVTLRLGNSNQPGVLSTIWNVSLATNDYLEVFGTSAGNTTLTAAKLELNAFNFGIPDSSRIKLLTFNFPSPALNQVAYFRDIPAACTISGWKIGLSPSGTATLKFWRIADGTANPTASNSISTSGNSLSSGAVTPWSTNVSDFTSTALVAHDIVAATITALSGSPTELQYLIGCTI